MVSKELPESIPAIVEPASTPAPAEEISEPLPKAPEESSIPPPVEAKPQLRFAEDLLVSAPVRKNGAKSGKRRKKGTREKRSDEDGIRLRKARRLPEISMGDDEEY